MACIFYREEEDIYDIVMIGITPKGDWYRYYGSEDKILSDGITIEYQGHDEPQSSTNPDPKLVDQPFQNRKS